MQDIIPPNYRKRDLKGAIIGTLLGGPVGGIIGYYSTNNDGSSGSENDTLSIQENKNAPLFQGVHGLQVPGKNVNLAVPSYNDQTIGDKIENFFGGAIDESEQIAGSIYGDAKGAITTVYDDAKGAAGDVYDLGLYLEWGVIGVGLLLAYGIAKSLSNSTIDQVGSGVQKIGQTAAIAAAL